MSKRDRKLPLPILCTVIAAVLTLVGLAGTALWYFLFPGINRLFDYTHFKVEETGYIITAEGKILNEATLTAKGTAKRRSAEQTGNSESYDFYFEISGYPADEQPASLWVDEDGVPKLRTSWQDVELINDRDSTQIDLNSKINYTTYLDEDCSEIIGCEIRSTQFDDTGSGTSDEPAVYFIPADTKEDAQARFGRLLEIIG